MNSVLRTNRGGHACCVLEDKVYLFGGEFPTGRGFDKDVSTQNVTAVDFVQPGPILFVFNFVTDSWMQNPVPAATGLTPRHGHTMTAVKRFNTCR